MKNRKALVRVAMVAFCAVVTGVVMSPTNASSAGRSCPWSGINCLDVYNPVTCSNGVTYPNACYARRACATGCGSSGGN